MPRTSSAPRFARRSSGTDAALYIRRLIFEGELRPGERVPQDELAKLADEFNESDDPEELESLAIDFHAAITGAARSPRINVVLRAMSGLVPGNFFELVPAAIEGERRGLTAIARAMKRRDGDRAATEYQRMMRRQADNVVAVFRERGLLDTASPDGPPGK